MISNLAVFMVATATVVAQGETSPHYEHLKFLERAIGVWSGEIQIQGTAIPLSANAKWGPDKSYVQQVFRLLGEDEQGEALAIIYWDAEAQKVKRMMFLNGGERSVDVATRITDDSAEYSTTSIRADGEVSKGTIVVKMGEGTLDVTHTDPDGTTLYTVHLEQDRQVSGAPPAP